MIVRLLTLASAAALAAAPASGSSEVVAGTPGQSPAESAALPEAPQPAPTGWVERATFTSDISEREPLDSIQELTNDWSKVYFFTELRGMEGQTVTHRWEFNGQVMAEVPFHVRGSRWRAYSAKNLEAIWLGEWTVTVVDETGRVLHTDRLAYRQAPPVTAVAPAADAPPAAPAP